MLDLQACKLPLFKKTVWSILVYFGHSSAGKKEHSEQREENTPRMYSMDNRCRPRDNDTKGCQRLSRIRAVNKAQNSWGRDIGTK